MKIRINGIDADIQLEAEKNVGDVLCGLDAWLSGSGHRLSGLCIDGESVGADSMESCFGRGIDSINILDINTSPELELFAESLISTMQDIASYETAGFEEKSLFLGQWKQSPQALLLAERNPALSEWAEKTFSGEGSSPQVFRLLLEERLRELQNPAAEMDKASPMVEEICARLEELPLDIQTGKDARAAETVNVFSGVAEKIFRIFNVLKAGGFPVGEITVEEMPISASIAEFDTALRELLAAYEQHDTVLVGDLAEYEMAPRLRSLHTAVLDGITRRSA
ncbi:MAG: hypothetical protein LBI06_08560 [Treponema sp.]|jgi:hypothetical protein|nr:hypothetical protein [Treponema sp.]